MQTRHKAVFVAPVFWEYPAPLIEGRLVRRYERFIAEVRVGRQVVRAHCVNPGRMEGLVIPGARVWLSEASAERALKYTWELIEVDGVLVGANTALPNTLVRRVLEERLLPGFDDVTRLSPERAFGRGHRVDFLLETPRGEHLVEVKNCHLVYPDGLGYFPDSHSERAVAHVNALARQVRRGKRATVLFTLQREDARGLRPSALHAPEFATAARRAARAGVALRAVRLLPSLEGFSFGGEVAVDVRPYDVRAVEKWARALEATTGWLRKDGALAGQSFAR
ncbi:MAG: DNA/RNA nuclease SfsA [Myxococcota bacterium]